tara:strand:+ start:2491 stop:3288 length:798 start_codon:yes stop_codon:yes gene_type:complete
MKTFNFCNNCGKQGHNFNQCKIPITSLGIIAFTKINGIFKILLICRKDSLGFVDFLRGRYNLDDKKYLLNTINIMTNNEKKKLENNSFSQLWNELWGNFIGIQYRGEELISNKKFNELTNGVEVNNTKFNLKDLLRESDTNWKDPEWGFPKGRRNYQERDQECAIREWEEETGYSAKDLDFLNNLVPYEEIFTGSNYKSYKHKYYIAYMNEIPENKCPNFQKTEVSKLAWVSFDEAINLIRPYNLERIKIINTLKNVLEQYSLYK